MRAKGKIKKVVSGHDIHRKGQEMVSGDRVCGRGRRSGLRKLTAANRPGLPGAGRSLHISEDCFFVFSLLH